jgi:hypothetical protein
MNSAEQKSPLQLFVVPVYFVVFLFLASILGALFIGEGHPSGVDIGFYYSLLLSPIAGIIGGIYAVFGNIEHPLGRYILALAINVLLVIIGLWNWWEFLGLGRNY